MRAQPVLAVACLQTWKRRGRQRRKSRQALRAVALPLQPPSLRQRFRRRRRPACRMSLQTAAAAGLVGDHWWGEEGGDRSGHVGCGARGAGHLGTREHTRLLQACRLQALPSRLSPACLAFCAGFGPVPCQSAPADAASHANCGPTQPLLPPCYHMQRCACPTGGACSGASLPLPPWLPCTTSPSARARRRQAGGPSTLRKLSQVRGCVARQLGMFLVVLLPDRR